MLCASCSGDGAASPAAMRGDYQPSRAQVCDVRVWWRVHSYIASPWPVRGHTGVLVALLKLSSLRASSSTPSGRAGIDQREGVVDGLQAAVWQLGQAASS